MYGSWNRRRASNRTNSIRNNSVCYSGSKKTNGQGDSTLPVFLTAFAAVLRENLREWTRPEVQISLDGQPSWAANRFQFGEAEVAPFLVETDDVAKENKIVA